MGYVVGFRNLKMYVVNPETIKNKYKCYKIVAEYLMHTCNIPLLCKLDNTYYFMDTSELEEALKTIPFWIKVCKELNL